MTCLPAIFILPIWLDIIYPELTGIQWVTPSPLSNKSAVSSPSANKDNNAWTPIWSLPIPNF